MADRLEVRDDRADLILVNVGYRLGALDRGDLFGVVDGLPFGALQKREVSERLFAEGQQQDLDPCRKRAGRNREIRPCQVRPSANGRQQVLDERHVEHFLLGDRQQRPAPAVDFVKLLGRHSL